MGLNGMDTRADFFAKVEPALSSLSLLSFSGNIHSDRIPTKLVTT